MGQKRSKLALLFSFITFQTINVAAQISGDGAPVGTDQFAELVLGVLNAVTPYTEITSISTGFFFLAVVAGFYFPAKFFTSKIFGMVEEALDLGRRYRTDDGEVPLGAKGFAFAVAFVSANTFAIFFGVYSLIIFGVLGLTIILASFLGIFNALGNSEYLSFGGNGDNDARTDGGTDTDTSPGPGGPGGPGGGPSESDIADVREEIGDVEETLKEQLDNQIGELRSELEEVDSEDDDLKDKIQDLRDDVGDLQEFETKVQEMFDNGDLSDEQFAVIEEMIEEASDLEGLEEQIEEHEDRLEDAESRLESQAETLEEHEKRISNIEETMFQELVRIQRELNKVNSEKASIRQEMYQISQRLAEGAEDRTEFEQEVERLRSRINTQQQQVKIILGQIEDLKQQDEELNSELEAVLDELKGEIPDEFESLKRRMKKVEEEVEKAQRGEKKEEEELNQFGFPEGWESDMMKNVISEEKLIAEEEKDELTMEEGVGEAISLIFGEEEEVAGEEKEIEADLEQLMMLVYRYAQQLEQDIVKEEETTEKLEKGEAEELEMEEEGIREIFAALSNMASGKTNMSPKQMESKAQKALQRLDQLEQNTSDEQELEVIERARDYAQQILSDEMQEEQDEEAIAMEDQERRKALMSGEASEEEIAQEFLREFGERLQEAQNRNFNSFQSLQQYWYSQQNLIQDFRNANLNDQQRNQIGEAERELYEYLNDVAENQFGQSLGRQM